MSREQRRLDRKRQAKTGGAASPPNRRTPVKAPGGGGPPWVPIGVVGGALVVVLLIVYLILQSTSGDGGGLSGPEKAEQDASPDLPGVFVPSQGRGHFNYTFSPDRKPTPFCDGVRHSGASDAGATAGATPQTTPAAQTTPTAQATSSGTPRATATPPQNCYNSNPPSSGRHLGVQRNVDVGGGVRINIPADPNVYPPDVIIPREAIAHGLEHAGVFVGYNCDDGDAACQGVVDQLTDLVNDRIDNFSDRVAMANDPDLPEGEIGVSSWTRVMNVKYQDYDEKEVERFIDKHSCRFDPEGFC
jgi:hypothetical protein